MDILERIYENNIDFVKNENFKGVKKIIVDNYSDEAHFVYEMLQNADDAKASEITFDLRKDRLIVSHDGVDFTEKDLVGICSISKGTKSDDYTKIGKFGIGFKSVFVYTESPQIYSKDYKFEIRELVLPQKIDDCEDSKANSTVFVLPFNAKKTQAIAWERIYKKLDSLHEEAILFLRNIKKINTVLDEEKSTIEKAVLNQYEFLESSMFEHIRITKMETGIEYDEDENENDASFYYLMKKNDITLLDTDEDGEVVEVNDQSVMIAYIEQSGEIYTITNDWYLHEDCFFVFFPTRIPANCEFFVHAPFVTKSSRDTIALNNDANDELMRNIGILAADSVIVLAKEKQLSVELIENMYFSDQEHGFGNSTIYSSFKTELIRLLQENRAIIPCADNNYKSIQSVLFTSEDREECEKLVDLFGIKWLSEFFEVQNVAEICFVDAYSDFFKFIREAFGCKKLDIESVINSLRADFYSEKSTEWYKKYVGLLIGDSYYGYQANYTNLDKLPLIRTKDGNHRTVGQSTKIYLNNGTIDESLLEDDKVNYLYREIFNLKEYSTELSDANEAIKRLSSTEEIDFNAQVELLRKVLIAVENKKITAGEIEKKEIFWVVNQKDEEKRKVSANDALVGRWERTNGTFDLYVLCQDVDIDLLDARYLESFSVQELRKLGCKVDGLSFIKGGMWEFFSLNGRPSLRWDANHIRPLVGRANNRLFQPLNQLNYFEEILETEISIEKSVIILRLAKEFDNQIKDWVEWSSRKDYADFASCHGYDECYSIFGAYLVNKPWMIDNQGNVVKPSEVTSEDLAVEYRKIMTADIADKIGLKRSSSEKMKSVNQKLESDGLFAIPIEEKEAYEEFKKQMAARKAEAQYFSELEKDESNNLEKIKNDLDIKPSTKVLKDILKKTKEISSEEGEKVEIDFAEEFDIDQDEYIPATIDYKKQIERAIQKGAAEINKITHFEELQNEAISCEKYTYGWFNALLEMESINSSDSNMNSREVTISFAKVEREAGTNRKRTLILKHPDRNIPQFIEELSDIPMILHLGDQTRTIVIEGISIKSYSLKVIIRNPEMLDEIDLNTVTAAVINAKSPVFLLEELRKQFSEFEYEDTFNMQENLCKNIEFVFGPPGTGKTTHLAKNVLIPMMKENSQCKVLVLTPTNKSADVLVKRIMEVAGDDTTYQNWLVRFGATGDEEIEQSPVYREKTFDIRTLEKSVTITTIARFPYDFFMPQGDRIFLYGINWDYIVIDEASMIPLANIIFPLYKKTPKKFIIAGDPFQIEPITTIDLWKNENIYTIVHLNSFTNPDTIPYKYKVELLTTQYRSIPDIGNIFSEFAYGGILKHHRNPNSQRVLNTGDDLGIETLNIIKFPVRKYESIYRCKRLQHSSSYQVYSALFTYEYVCYLSRIIAANNPGEVFKIGVIAPYRAQADMIDKLLVAESLPKEIEVLVGTIHGFQGDECDIIFAVFNTPPSISASKDMFLNKKNIINVSISRARDYLFIVMPDDNTENIENLRLVKKVESLIHNTDVWNEFNTPDLEELMFGDSMYLENNAFSTSHQSVNVYGLPEKKYEIRSEDNAVDVQIHKEVKVDISGKTDTIEDGERSNSYSEYIDSYDLDETMIPEELRDEAIDLPVHGAINGWCYLVPYEGKLSQYTVKKTTGMFVKQYRNGQEKMISVSVIEKDRVIYISKDSFKIYEQGLSEPDGIKICRTFFDK